MINIKITPKFKAQQIYAEGIGGVWFEFQNIIHNESPKMINKIHDYISSNHKREGGTGKLAGSIQVTPIEGMAQIGFGIGEFAKMDSEAPYWYQINYGKLPSGAPFVPGGGKYAPHKYTDGSPNPELRGKGTSKALEFSRNDIPVTAVRPMNFVEYSIRIAEDFIREAFKQVGTIGKRWVTTRTGFKTQVKF